MTRQIIAPALALISASACLPRQQYVYPVSLQDRAPAMEQHLHACAVERNYSARQLMSMTWVNLDKDTLLVFDFASHDEPHFTVRQDHAAQTTAEKEATFDAAKDAGQDLLHCAHARTNGPG